MIPSYLSNIAIEKSNDKKKTCLSIKCPCGCEDFKLYKRKKDSMFLKQEKEYTKKIIKEYGRGFEMKSDKKGDVYILKRNFFGFVTKKEIFNQIDIPVFMNYISSKCNNCRREYVLFDQQLHGYDKHINDCYIYNDKISYPNEASKIEINLYYNLENIDIKHEDSTIMFGRIVIFSNIGLKKKKIIDIECE